MHLEQLQAFVLSTSVYGESDRIATLFTLEHGRIKGFARGARNSRKRFGPALEPFARINIQLSLKDGLSSLRSADIFNLYSAVRGNLSAIAHALYVCELVEFLTPEGHPLPRLFRLMVSYFERLESGFVENSDRRMFEINLLNILGYRPALDSCSGCGGDFDSRGGLMQRGGEILCRLCAATGRTISISALHKLELCLCTGRFGAVSLDENEQITAGALLDELLVAHSGRKWKSLEFLEQVCD